MTYQSRLYEEYLETPVEIIDGSGHTMIYTEFAKYVSATKFSEGQKRIISNSLDKELPIKIIGCYQNHLSFLLIEYNKEIIEFETREPRRIKKFNRFRPIVYSIKSLENGCFETWIVTFPSKEYVDQIAELTGSFSFLYFKENLDIEPNLKSLNKISVVHYPKLELELTSWTNLDSQLSRFIKRGDIAVIGHVEELNSKLLNLRNFENVISSTDFGLDDLFTAYILRDKKTKKRIVLIGFAHSYWGSASGLIAKAIVEKGAKTLFYIAKAGNLISPDIVRRTVSPNEYYLLDRENSYDNWRVIKAKVPIWPDRTVFTNVIGSGIHITVPTVIGETYKQASNYESLKPATIDNEIGHIAKEIHNYNQKDESVQDVNFICIHFITDFLHLKHDKRKAKKSLADAHNVNKHRDLKQDMSKFLENAAQILHFYIIINGLLDSSVKEDQFEENHRDILKRIVTGIASAAISTDDEFVHSELGKSKKFVDDGTPYEAIDFILMDMNYRDLSSRDKLEIIVIKQKYGLISEARSDWNVAMDIHKEEITDQEKIEFYIVDAKLRTQSGEYDNLEEECVQLVKAAAALKLYPKIPAIYHRACYAAFHNGGEDRIEKYISSSKGVSKNSNDHAYNTAIYTSLILKSLSNINTVNMGTIDNLVEVQKVYLNSDVDPSYWQANKLKSVLSVLFAEAILLMKIDPTRSNKIFTIANYFMPISGCSQYSEGFAELLFLIKQKETKLLVLELMKESRITPDMLFYGRIQRSVFLSIRHILHDYKTINTSEELMEIRKRILN